MLTRWPNFRVPRTAAIACAILALGLVGQVFGDPPPAGPVLSAVEGAQRKLQFNRDIRPILSDTCFKCHGHDGKARKADLRLDLPEGAFAARKRGAPIVSGHPESSQAYQRLISKDPEMQMPPPTSHLSLTPAQVETIRLWIAQGAEYQPHWAFISPKDSPIPVVKDAHWPINPIDSFILARLEEEGMAPSPPADRRTLIRRLTLDLTGLPPTPAEVNDFLADSSPDAYEKCVDRLLASPRYGERMAADWLDAARYADTNGYQSDPTRTMWPWRDWVIKAMNDNMPFDQFTVAQMAGDLILNGTMDQRLASGFNRNHPYNGEGGAISEEVRVTNVLDRVDTTATTFLGLTVGCAKCHDHKYDPVTQKDYYSLFAYFNQCSETGNNPGGSGNAAPVMNYAPPSEQVKVAELRQKQKEADGALAAVLQGIDTAQAEWEKTVAQPAEFVAIVPSSVASANAAWIRMQDDGTVLAGGTSPLTDVQTVVLKTDLIGVTAIRLEALPSSALPHEGPGRAVENGNFVLTQIEGEAVSTVDSKQSKKLAFASAFATYSQPGWSVAAAIAGNNPNAGWAVMGAPDKNNLSATFNLAEPIGFAGGCEVRLHLHYDSVHPMHTMGHFRLSIATGDVVPPEVRSVLAIEPSKRDAPAKNRLRDYYRVNVNPQYKRLSNTATLAKKTADDFEQSLPHVMVMDDATKRQTHILMRGQYDKPGDPVEPGAPAFLPPLPKDLPNNRLALARWLVDPANPLTARVIVNHYWQAFFGVGIVKTADDFGTQGEPPTHPELLDYLAHRFVSSGWDVKAIHRLIVTSATYRQGSKITADLLEKDPSDRLLERAPRFRRSIFAIRDQALAASGLLIEKVGGKPVKPYQPPGVWEEMSLGQIGYSQDHGEDIYRRSIYTFWRRTVAPASMFDVSPRTVCMVKVSRTNTPLQALTLENDPTYVEAARVLSQQLLIDKSTNTEQKFDELFLRLMARPASDAEKKILSSALDRLKGEFQADPQRATKLISVGEKPRDPSVDPFELASWTALIDTVMNMDETITRE